MSIWILQHFRKYVLSSCFSTVAQTVSFSCKIRTKFQLMRANCFSASFLLNSSHSMYIVEVNGCMSAEEILKFTLQKKTKEGLSFHFAPFAYDVHEKGCPIENVRIPSGASTPPRCLFRTISHNLFRLKPQWDIKRKARFLDPPKSVSDNSVWGFNQGRTGPFEKSLLSYNSVAGRFQNL